jgi:hypothetical protein
MLRMLARAQSGQVQTRTPLEMAGDHDKGGGTDGVGTWQVKHLREWNESLMPPG